MGRTYMREKKGAFEKKAKELGALYVEDDDEAIFVCPGQWNEDKIGSSGCYDVDYSKPAILWAKDSGTDVGRIMKSCDNFVDKSYTEYDKTQTQWIARKLLEIAKVM